MYLRWESREKEKGGIAIMGRTISRLFIIIIAQAVVLSACDSCKRPDKGNTNANLEQTSNKIELLKTDTLVVNVYVDKTGDMQGYFKDKSDIRDIIERYLKEIGKIDTNKPYKAIKFNGFLVGDGTPLLVNVNSSDFTNEFVNQLIPSKFTDDSSNLASWFSKITHLGNDTVSLFFSNCIFSRGGGQDSDNRLNSQESKINSVFSELANNNCKSVLIYQFNGEYDGVIMNKEDKNPKNFNGKRPFYLWVIGENKYLKSFRTFENQLISVPVQNTCVVTHQVQDLNYAIIPNAGDYRLSKIDTKHAIVKARLSKGKGHMENKTKTLNIAINVDFHDLLVDTTYLLNKANYTTNNTNYTVDTILKSRDSRFTHTIKMTSTSIEPADVNIILLNNLPSWIEKYNDDIGATPDQNDSIQRTYGLEKLVGSVYSAYTQRGKSLYDLKISVNKNKK